MDNNTTIQQDGSRRPFFSSGAPNGRRDRQCRGRVGPSSGTRVGWVVVVLVVVSVWAVLEGLPSVGAGSRDDNDRGGGGYGSKKDKEPTKRTPTTAAQELELKQIEQEQKETAEFVLFLSKVLVVSWLVIVVLVFSFLYQYRTTRAAIAVQPTSSKLRTATAKRSPTESRQASTKRLKDLTSSTEAAAAALGSEAASEKKKKPKDGKDLLHSSSKKKLRDTASSITSSGSLSLGRNSSEVLASQLLMNLQAEEEKRRVEDKLEAILKEKCIEEGKRIELEKRIEDEKDTRAELEDRNAELAEQLEEERIRNVELSRQLEELNAYLRSMLSAVDTTSKKRHIRTDSTDSTNDSTASVPVLEVTPSDATKLDDDETSIGDSPPPTPRDSEPSETTATDDLNKMA